MRYVWILNTLPNIVVDEINLFLRKLEELQLEFQDLQQNKIDRQKHVLDLLNTVNSLCLILGIDFKKKVTEIHPNWG